MPLINNNLLIQGRLFSTPETLYNSFSSHINKRTAAVEFDGLRLDELQVSVNLHSHSDVLELIDILYVLQHCFDRPPKPDNK